MSRFKPGIDVLLGEKKHWLKRKRVGLLSHSAAVNARGVSTAERLRNDPDVDLVCLLGPEHGFFGKAGAGELCRSAKHPRWDIPVFSLYGRSKKPTKSMLKNLDVIVYDVQDLGVRCYTYVSTLKLLLEAASEYEVEVIVADRPIPLPDTVDGPMLRKTFRSFVSLIDVPMVYGMTPGETAIWLNKHEQRNARVKIAKMKGYNRQNKRGRSWPPWMPPSPAIRSWESAQCYPMTVCFEALGAIDHGRRTATPFQLLGSSWTKGTELSEAMNALKLPGVRFYPKRYNYVPGKRSTSVNGIKIEVTRPGTFKPILTGVCLVQCLQDLCGKNKVWAKSSARPDFFDKLFGTDSVRKALLAGEDGKTIAAGWEEERKPFEESRLLLYSI